MAAAGYALVSWIIAKLRIDDPLDVVAVHGAGGLIGTLIVPIFDERNGLVYFGNDKGFVEKFGWQVMPRYKGRNGLGWIEILCGLDLFMDYGWVDPWAEWRCFMH